MKIPPMTKIPIPTLFRDCVNTERKRSISAGNNWTLSSIFRLFVSVFSFHNCILLEHLFFAS